jgi:hypothetical protein
MSAAAAVKSPTSPAPRSWGRADNASNARVRACSTAVPSMHSSSPVVKAPEAPSAPRTTTPTITQTHHRLQIGVGGQNGHSVSGDGGRPSERGGGSASTRADVSFRANRSPDLPPGLLFPPDLRPRHDLTPIPSPARTLAADRRGEPGWRTITDAGWWVTPRRSAISETLTVLGPLHV